MAQYSSHEHGASESAALVALNLISFARVVLKLDIVYTKLSAQYLLKHASLNNDVKLTVKDCLEFALKEGIPRADAWPHLGFFVKPPSAYKLILVSVKGEVVEGKKIEDACMMLKHQPVGARLHVFTPDIDLGRISKLQMAQYSSHEHGPSESATLVALNLISSARVILKLDTVYTELSAQYLLEHASRNNDVKLTVKDCLEFALKEGIPRADAWPHLGSLVKPPSAYKPDLVSVKRQVIEGKKIKDACKMLEHQPVGARLHVFSPDIDLVGKDGIYDGISRKDSRYVGLRDVIIVYVEEIEGELVAEVRIRYKKKVSFIKVSLSRMFMSLDDFEPIGPTSLLVDFCVPCLSIN